MGQKETSVENGWFCWFFPFTNRLLFGFPFLICSHVGNEGEKHWPRVGFADPLGWARLLEKKVVHGRVSWLEAGSHLFWKFETWRNSRCYEITTRAVTRVSKQYGCWQDLRVPWGCRWHSPSQRMVQSLRHSLSSLLPKRQWVQVVRSGFMVHRKTFEGMLNAKERN